MKNQHIATYIKDAAVWNPERFRDNRTPLRVGKIEPSHLKADNLPCALNMRIKNAGDSTFHLPDPYAQSTALISMIIQSTKAEAKLNPMWQDYNAYLTVDNRYVKAGTHQRGNDWHFESMQGARYQKKLPTCQFFVAATAFPTEFYTGGVDASSLHETRDDWFKALARQVEQRISNCLSEAERRKLIHVGAPGDIEAFSSYQMHRSPEMPEDVQRTVIRLEFTQKTLETVGDSTNPLLASPTPAPVHDPFQVVAAHKQNFTGNAFDERSALGGISVSLGDDGDCKIHSIGNHRSTPGR